MAKRGYVLSENAGKKLREVVRKHDSTPKRITKAGGISHVFTGGSPVVFVLIDGGVSIGPNRWLYSGIRWAPTAPGQDPANWDVVLEDGNPITVTDIYNTLEAFNSAAGIQGNGINVDTLPVGFTLRPLSDGFPILPLYLGKYVTAPNAVDGVCPP